MSPSLPHEQARTILAILVNIICEERTLDVVDLGSTTHKRPDLLKGIEPDGCFYIQNADVIRGQRKLDLLFLPPADLAIESDVPSPSLPKLPIYAAIGVSEVWVYSDGQVRFFKLENDSYIQSDESGCLLRVVAGDITRFVNESAAMKRPQWLRNVRKWVRSLD
jgi:Uma2 family endonuclease